MDDMDWLNEPYVEFKDGSKIKIPEENKKLIKSILCSRPPDNNKDLYHTGDYWSKYGAVYAGVATVWKWYEKVICQLTQNELEIVNFKLKHNH